MRHADLRTPPWLCPAYLRRSSEDLDGRDAKGPKIPKDPRQSWLRSDNALGVGANQRNQSMRTANDLMDFPPLGSNAFLLTYLDQKAC